MKLYLKQRLILITSSTVLVTALSVFLLSQQLFGSFMRERFFERLSLLSRHLASGVVLGIILRDKDMLSRFARSVMKEESIVAVEILTGDQKRLVLVGRPEAADGVIVEKVVPGSSQEPFQERRALGFVKLYYSTVHLDRLLHRLFWQVLLVSLLLALVMSLAGYFLITRALVRPLNELLRAVQRVEKGELHVKVSGKGLPETEELAQAFSEMLASLKASREELKRTYEEMLRTRSMAEIGRFSLSIAHEIKNPLGIIKGSLDILKKPAVPEEIRQEMIQYIEEEVRRLDNLIQNFLAFARPQRIKPQPVRPEEVLSSVARRLALEYGAERVEWEAEEGLPQAKLDAEHLERALLNLVKNAFEAGAKHVWLRAKREDSAVVFEVEDDGPGVPEDLREKIFEPFFTTKAKGTGLGLSMVLQVVEAHGGRVELKERSPHGTLFRLVFKTDKEEKNGLHPRGG